MLQRQIKILRPKTTHKYCKLKEIRLHYDSDTKRCGQRNWPSALTVKRPCHQTLGRGDSVFTLILPHLFLSASLSFTEIISGWFLLPPNFERKHPVLSMKVVDDVVLCGSEIKKSLHTREFLLSQTRNWFCESAAWWHRRPTWKFSE